MEKDEKGGEKEEKRRRKGGEKGGEKEEKGSGKGLEKEREGKREREWRRERKRKGSRKGKERKKKGMQGEGSEKCGKGVEGGEMTAIFCLSLEDNVQHFLPDCLAAPAPLPGAVGLFTFMGVAACKWHGLSHPGVYRQYLYNIFTALRF
jgi:hypothetical protein